MNRTQTLDTRCGDGGVACQHVAALTKAGQVAIHVMGYPEHGQRLLEHARLLAEVHRYGVDGPRCEPEQDEEQ